MMAITTKTVALKVLVVDDEPVLRFLIAEVLKDAGLTVVEAATADEAIAQLRLDTCIRLVFSDIRMPGSMDGIGLARAIEADFATVRVMLTSGNTPSHIEPGRPVIAKPYDLAAVSAQIVDALARLAA